MFAYQSLSRGESVFFSIQFFFPCFIITNNKALFCLFLCLFFSVERQIGPNFDNYSGHACLQHKE